MQDKNNITNTTSTPGQVIEYMKKLNRKEDLLTELKETAIILKSLAEELINLDEGKWKNKYIPFCKEYENKAKDIGRITSNYSGVVYKYTQEYGFENLNNEEYLLPPFLVFPLYSPTSLGWRMGSGADYAEYWAKFMKNLSKEERNEYLSKYEYPEWWIIDGYPHSRYSDLPWKNRIA